MNPSTFRNPQFSMDMETVLSRPSTAATILSSVYPGVPEMKLLTNIPSETALEERLFLYNVARYVSNGQSNILEVGPFLGGTTRALALGLSHNPNRADHVKVKTYDRFEDYLKASDYYKLLTQEHFGGAFKHLAEQYLDKSDDEVCDFFELFTQLHSPYDYWNLMEANVGVLPNSKAEDPEENPFSWSPETRFGIIHVDGCKAWYHTKYFLQSVVNHVEDDAMFIFQDYSWRTCFWITAIVELLQDHFTYVGGCASTRAFTLIPGHKSALAEDIARLPDAPEELNASDFHGIYGRLGKKAARLNDSHMSVNIYLHLAAALLYIGEKTAACRVYASLQAEPLIAQHFLTLVQEAMASPTYRPDGQQVLLAEAV